MLTLLAVLAAYLVGSISFAVVASWTFGLPDPRTYGSGNPGATNVLRTGRKAAALVTFLGDAGKGAALVLLARWAAPYLGLTESALAAIAVAAFLGHLYPVYLGFKGGKGVATYIGVLLGLCWPAALAFCAIWVAVAAVFRYSSLAALVASAMTPLALWLFGLPTVAAIVALLTLLLWIKHRGNIARLLSGTEGKIGAKTAS